MNIQYLTRNNQCPS